MSDSSDEGIDDGLNIKPPQPGGIHRKQKEKDRSRRDRSYSRHSSKQLPSQSSIKGGEFIGSSSEHRRRHHHREERDRRIQIPPLMERERPRERYVQQMEEYSEDRRRHKHHRSRRDRGEPISDGRSSSKSLDMLQEAQLKRRELELEEMRTFKNITRRMQKEKESRRERHKAKKSKRSRSDSKSRSVSSATEDDFREKEGLVEKIPEHIIEVQDIEGSPSDLEEGEERSPINPDTDKLQRAASDRSDVSSTSEPAENVVAHEEEEKHQVEHNRGKEKDTSDVSSSSDSTRKSHSEASDVSSSSSSSDTDSEDDQDKEHDNDDGPKPSKVARTMSPERTDSDKSKDLPKKENSNSSAPEVIITDTSKPETIPVEELLPPYYPALQGCRRVEEFTLLNRIEEGTYGVVYRAQEKRTDEIVALKRLKMEKEKDGFPITSLREINTLLKAQHENIVTVREIVVGSNTDKIFLVMDYVEHDLKALMETLKQKGQVFLPEEVKCLVIQLLRAVAHLHDNWILHRDLKTSNLLLSHKGILKVGDFGLAREYGSPLKAYTPIVVTLWYRAPELLLGTKEYSTPIDIWSVGCIFGELLRMEPMFPGKSEANQLNLIFQSLGTPNDRIWPGYSKMPLLQKMTFADYPLNKLKPRFGHRLTDVGIDLMNKFLTFNPAKRITAEEALKHPFFKEVPLPIQPSMFPTWPAKSELGHRKAAASPKPPSGGHQFKGLKEDDSRFYLGGGDARTLPVGAGFSLKF